MPRIKANKWGRIIFISSERGAGPKCHVDLMQSRWWVNKHYADLEQKCIDHRCYTAGKDTKKSALHADDAWSEYRFFVLLGK